MALQSPVVDSDGHILEPPDLWQRYLEKQYVDRAIRFDRDEDGLEILLFDDQVVEIHRGTLGAMGGVQAEDAEAEIGSYDSGRTYVPGWMGPRIKRSGGATEGDGRRGD